MQFLARPEVRGHKRLSSVKTWQVSENLSGLYREVIFLRTAFNELLLEQFHRFCLDFYQGYQIRETSFAFVEDQLIIQGYAYDGNSPGARRFPFTTLARQEQPVQFMLDKAAAETFV